MKKRLFGFFISAALVASMAMPAAQAYSLYGNATNTQEGSLNNNANATTTTGFDLTSGWNELTGPFQGFLKTIQTVRPTDIISFNPLNKTVQIQPTFTISLQDIFNQIQMRVETLWSGVLNAGGMWKQPPQ
jgi:hypothetical protein